MQGYVQQSVNNVNQGVQYSQQQMSGQMNTFSGQNNQGTFINTSGNFINSITNNKKMLYGIIGGIVALIVIVVLFINFGDGGYNAIKGYMSGMKSFDAKKVAKYTHKGIIEMVYDDFDDYVDALEDQFETYEDNGYKVLSYEIDKDYDEYDEDEVEEFAEGMSYYDIDEDSVKKVRKYSVKVKTKSDGKTDISRVKIVVYKVDGKWYISD